MLDAQNLSALGARLLGTRSDPYSLSEALFNEVLSELDVDGLDVFHCGSCDEWLPLEDKEGDCVCLCRYCFFDAISGDLEE